VPLSSNDPADDLTLAITDTLRAALVAVPRSELSSDALTQSLARHLAQRLSAAVIAAGGTVPDFARALASRSAAEPSRGSTLEERILVALRRHPAGTSPGVTPESLASLTGLLPGVLAPAVSALVQAGELVRDAWLVRLPSGEDLLPGAGEGEARSGQSRQTSERRAIGDRRATGERRLYDRRTPPTP
jgi:hypothetical protein